MKRKKPTLKQAKKKAWDMFSKYIRRSFTRVSDGTAVCYTCGSLRRWEEMDAGHGIPGRNNAVLFMEEVVKPQCQQCNRFKHGRLEIFTVKLIDELGRQKYDKLVILSNQIVQYKVNDYLEIYDKYHHKLAELIRRRIING